MSKQPISDEARRLRNEYARKWRAANRDKVKAANDRYWQKKAVEATKSEERAEASA